MQTQLSTSIFDSEITDKIIGIKNKLRTELIYRISELPSSFRTYFYRGAILTGGVTASVWHDEEVNDYDVYLTNLTDADNFTRYVITGDAKILEIVKDVNPKYMTTKVKGKLVTANAITFKNKLQVITCVDKDQRPKFDFLHCMPYYDIMSDKFFISAAQVDSIKRKKLIHNPQSTQKTNREKKFLERGWIT